MQAQLKMNGNMNYEKKERIIRGAKDKAYSQKQTPSRTSAFTD
jgi:hypothetical protein